MRIWVVGDHEPLPVDPGDRRLMRTGMLCTALAAAGHDTIWFTSTNDHYLKRRREPAEAGVAARPNLTLRILAAPGYRKNVSMRRLLHNAMFARAFRRVAAASPVPDIVVATLPSTDAASAAIGFAVERKIPSVIDVVDIWPDSFLAFVPAPLRRLGALPISMLDRQLRRACTGATSVVAISDGYLRWARSKGQRSSPPASDRIVPLGNMPEILPDAEACGRFLQRLGVSPGQRIVGFVGTWGHSHDFELVYAAARQLADRADVRFVLAGDITSQPELHRRLAGLPNVTLPGWLGATEMAILLHATDIGLLPYRRGAPQSLPNKLYEYMSYGAFQIATLDGELGDLYRRTGTGRAVEPAADALAEAICDQLAVPIEPGERARRIAVFEDNFAGEAVYRLMVEHIEGVAARRRRDEP